MSRVALYHHRLAVQLPDRVAIYELGGAAGADGVSGDYDMHYRTKDKIFRHFDAQHMGKTKAQRGGREEGEGWRLP